MEENKNEEMEKQENIEPKSELEQKVESLEKENAETTDRLKRLMAEFENYKKRSQKEREGQYISILSEVVSSMLPVFDNLEKAATAQTKDDGYKQGVEMVLKQLQDTLSGMGVKKIEAVGNSFDPELHDAISHVEDESLGEQIVKEEFRTGYIIGDKVIRHSMVIVAN